MFHRVSVENSISYLFEKVLSIPRILRMLGLEYARVVNMSRLHRVLREVYFKDSRLF